MAHVHSYSQRDEDGIFLYDKNKRRIGGPYATEEEATIASKAVSEAMGERPVEDYKEFFHDTAFFFKLRVSAMLFSYNHNRIISFFITRKVNILLCH